MDRAWQTGASYLFPRGHLPSLTPSTSSLKPSKTSLPGALHIQLALRKRNVSLVYVNLALIQHTIHSLIHLLTLLFSSIAQGVQQRLGLVLPSRSTVEGVPGQMLLCVSLGETQVRQSTKPL